MQEVQKIDLSQIDEVVIEGALFKRGFVKDLSGRKVCAKHFFFHSLGVMGFPPPQTFLSELDILSVIQQGLTISFKNN